MRAKLTTWQERIRAVGLLACVNLGILVAAVGVFIWIAHHVASGDLLEMDHEVMRAVRTGEPPRPIGPPWLAEVARDITGLGSVVALTTFVALVVGFLALSRRFGAALFLFAAAVGGQTLNASLKAFYGRERPDPAFRWLQIDSPSFPSGHATSSAVIYLTLAVLLVRLADTRAQRIYLISAAVLLSFFVGISRVYLGVHFPTDVIAGWAIGIAWAQLCWFAARAIGRRRLAKTSE